MQCALVLLQSVPTRYAARCGLRTRKRSTLYVAVVQALLAAKANANAAGPNGETPLMVAAAQGYDALIRPLLKAGANVEAKDARGQTALARATQKNHAYIMQLLEEAAAQQ